MSLKYNLYKLGSFQFEEIVKSVLKAELGIGIESWGRSKDYGIDAFFEGKLRYPSNIENEGVFIFQIKFSSLTNKREAFNSLRSGFAEWIKGKRFEKLIKNEKGKVFHTLITNVDLTVKQKQSLRNLVKRKLQIKERQIKIMDGKDVCSLLDKHPEIRYSYPQILGLQDLNNLISKVVNKPFYERSKILIEEAHDYSKIFVPTSPYKKAIETLEKYSFVVLEGPPEVGKTVTAYIIALNKLNDGWEVYDCKTPEDFFNGYNGKKRQIFVADDAFGTTEYDPTIAEEWARELHRVLRKLDKKHWFIWTTRTHILMMAKERMELKAQAEKFPEPGDVIVNVDKFSRLEKALILYRHAKNKDLTDEGKFLIKNYWRLIIDNQYFTPLRIKNLLENSLPEILKNIRNIKRKEMEKVIKEYIEKPTESLRKAFSNLPKDYKTFLFSMLDCESTGEIYEYELKKSFQRHCKNCETEFEKILSELKGSFVNYSYLDWKKTGIIKWIHPSIRDLLIEILKRSSIFKTTFIKNCRLGGIKLLIAPEDENTPSNFLITDKDWENIIENIKSNMAGFTISEVGSLLRNVRAVKDIYLKSGVKEYFLNFVKIALKETKKIIQNKDMISEDIPGTFIIEIFYELSILFFPDNEITPLDITSLWKNLYVEANNMLNSYSSIDYKLIVLEELILLFKILKKYEPMYLLRFNWEEEISKLFMEYLNKIKDELGTEILDDNPEILYAESEIWSNVRETLKKLRYIFFKYGAKINKEEKTYGKINNLLNKLERVSKKKALHYQDEAVGAVGYEEPEEYTNYEPIPRETITGTEISKIFDDL